jgi:hypothetical protein
MKTLITTLCAIATLCASAQINETFTNGIPQGWQLGQGMSLTSYENPLANCTTEMGATTSNIGNQGTSYIATSQIPFTSGLNINISFKIFVFDANLKCNSTKNFPCNSFVKIYLVRNNYGSSGTPPPSEILAQSTNVSLLGNQVNSVIFSAASLSSITNGTLYRVYIDFNVPSGCNQGNTKYVMDDIRVLELMPGTLPVKFSSFTATRKKQQVFLNWETATEIDNKGFTVQIKSGNAEWRSLGFVASKANGGNSNGLLNYNYTDVNISDEITQYRLEQIDQDGKKEYSDIRTVKAEKLSIPILLYPNPATGGKFHIVMDDAAATYEIMVSDASGSTVKSYSGFRGASLVIDGLKNGFYLVSVKDIATKEIFTEKLIVKE